MPPRVGPAIFVQLRTDRHRRCFLLACLRGFRFRISEIVAGGGNRTTIARKIDGFLADRGWKATQFHTAIKVDAPGRLSPTHKVDRYKQA